MPKLVRVSDEAHLAAKLAAVKAGMTLEQYLNKLILKAAT